MKLRSFFYALAASVLVLLLIAGGVLFWLVAHSPLALLRVRPSIPEAAMFVPRQAPVMVSLLVNPDRLEAFRQVVASPQTRRQSRVEFNQLRQSLLESIGLDYQIDIQPWLGEEITFAVTTLDIDNQLQNGQQPGYLLALDIRDPERSREFLQHFQQKQALAGNLVFEQYQGVELIHTVPYLPGGQPSNSSQPIKTDQDSGLKTSLAIAKVGDRFVLFANHPKVLRNAINNVQVPDLGIVSTRQYQQTLASLQQGRIGFTFLNLPELLAGTTAEETSPQPSPQTSAQTHDGLAIGWGLNRQGLLAETALVSTTVADANLDTGPTPPLSHPVQALQYLPANTPLAASGAALNHLWSQVSPGLMRYELVAKLVNQPLEDLKVRWGLDLPQDIFAWVKGEYAVGIVPRSPSDSRGVSRLNWLFVAERAEPEAVQSAIQHLDAIAKQQGLGVSPLMLEGGQEVLTWTQLVSTATISPGSTLRADAVDPQILRDSVPEASPTLPRANLLQARVTGAHTSVNQYEILAASLEVANQALQAPENSLVNSDHFKAAIAPLPQLNNGYFYLDWAASRPLLEQRFPILQVVEIAGKPLLSRLRSLTLTSYGREAGVYRSQVFIRMGP